MSYRQSDRSRQRNFDRGPERWEDERRSRDERGYDDRDSGFRDRESEMQYRQYGRDSDMPPRREARFDRDFEREPGGWRPARYDEWDRQREDLRDQWSASDRRYPNEDEQRRWQQSGSSRTGSYGGPYSTANQYGDDQYGDGEYGTSQSGAGEWSGAHYGRSSDNHFGGQYRDRPYRGHAMNGEQWDSGRISTWGGDSQQGARRFDHDSSGQRRGRYAGKGPKGYKRSDERIREDVCDMLSRGHIDASDVEVEVSNGEVTLKGTVPEREMKHTAERMIDQLGGVSEVTNQIRVKRGSGMQDQNTRSSSNGPTESNRNERSTSRT